jgi:thiol-disulfide isomerase/thioredoxin
MSALHLFKGVLLVSLCVLANNVHGQDSEGEPNPIKWSLKTRSAAPVKAGDRFVLELSAQIDRGWHLYSTERVEGGPIPTRILLATGQPLEISGEIDSPAPQSSYDPNFQLNTESYDGSVGFLIPVKVLAGAPSDLKKVRVQVRYQTCSQTTCLPPKVLELETSIQLTSANDNGQPTMTSVNAKSGNGPALNAVVPDFSFTDFSGKARRFSEYRGHYVLLDFWASWCSPCLADIPKLKESYAKYRALKFEIIGMDSETLGQDQNDAAFAVETRARAREIVRTRGVTWTQATSETSVPVAVKIFGIENLPAKILIDPEGRIVARIKEGSDLDAILTRILSGKE